MWFGREILSARRQQTAYLVLNRERPLKSDAPNWRVSVWKPYEVVHVDKAPGAAWVESGWERHTVLAAEMPTALAAHLWVMQW